MARSVDELLAMVGSVDISEASSTLEHAGVKGMKWGVRKDEGHQGERAKTKTIEKLDKKYEKLATSPKVILDVYNNAAIMYNNESVGRINSKAKYKNVDPFDEKSKLTQEYNEEHKQAFQNHLRKEGSLMSTNASGTRGLKVNIKDDGSWELEIEDLQHSNLEPGSKIPLIVKRDSKHRIVSINLPDDALKHDDSLKHYGIKGMRWGKRKSSSSSDSTPSKPNSADHEETRALLKSGSAKTLSNAEIKKINERLQLERTLGDLTLSQGTFNKGKKRAKDVLEVGTTMQTAYNLINGPMGKAVATAIKTAA